MPRADDRSGTGREAHGKSRSHRFFALSFTLNFCMLPASGPVLHAGRPFDMSGSDADVMSTAERIEARAAIST